MARCVVQNRVVKNNSTKVTGNAADVGLRGYA